ncbi:MAG: DUF3825 domain-containing protein [Lachnospiraceae bacterium]|nr:DUF3825 domain-containing protein [Lachnospiraceae bacterium]
MKQFPDPGLYRASRVGEWLVTNGYSLEGLGFGSFREFAENFSEMFSFQEDNNDEFIEIKRWQTGEKNMIGSIDTRHPADSFFGSGSIILNDDIIEMTQQSLYALTKILSNGLTVQQMKQEIYRKFDEAKTNGKLVFLGERYTFPIDYCPDGLLVNGVITKNLSLRGKSLYFAFDKTRIYRASDVREYKNPPQTGSIPEEDKDMLYKMLTDYFPCNKQYHMAAVSKFLSDRGVDRMKYGFFKMKDFLSELGFMRMDDAVLGGVPQTMITIVPRDGSDSPLPVQPPQPARPAYFDGYEPPRRAPESAADANTIPTGRLTDFCNLPIKPMGILEKYLHDKGMKVDFSIVVRSISDDYDRARAEGSVRIHDAKLIFPVRYLKDDGTHIELTLKPSTYEGKKWFLYYVDTVPRDRSALFGDPGRQLENFAFLGSWSNFLTELATRAVDEEWDFSSAPIKNHQILMQYIKYTFSRLTREKKVCISQDRQFAAFNTGLADNHYDDIYACFAPNDPDGSTEWKFIGFCTAASGGLGKQLVNYFNPLPQPPSYFKRNEDLFFDHTKQLHTDFEHIIIDNIKRLPPQFLYDQFFDNSEARQLVEDIRACGHDRFERERRDELYDELRDIIRENSRLFMRIQNRLKDSIELARKRVRWNYKTAVPSYFPKRDSMSLMLPLALLDENIPDVALVVELTRSGSYQGQTILTLPQAYIDARLMCRITGDWLTPSIFGGSGSAQESVSDDELSEME